ncbi:hypothetical protein N7526_004656 [Penicillium atrosanguineum]|nr:hypothetical protein N7526_004656 [Penicillium atrosanguineum]
MASSKNVVFDIVGTLVSYDYLYNAIDHRLGDRLRAEGVKPSLLGQAWMETAEREYTNLSISGRYQPFAKVLEALFYRLLWMGGIKEPRNFASPEDLAYIMTEYQSLTMRPGAAECVKKLRDAGFTVWAFTAADLKRVGGYFEKAGVPLPAENLLSCDSVGIGKPDLAAYKPLLDRLTSENEARSRGLLPLICGMFQQPEQLEMEALTNLFGEMDVIDATLPGMADKIIADQAAF